MDGPDKGFSSSMSTKPPSSLKISESDAGGLNENITNYSLQNPKKSTIKNFMSPTISAASKATLPRKKILAERNEASGSILSDTHFSKTAQDTKSPLADVGTNGSDVPLCRISPLSYRASESEGDDQNSAPDSSSRPYDPLTNYLSPRPKFLRYNPNRRREIFLLRENEIKDGKDPLSISRSVSFDSQNAGDGDGARDTSSEGGSVPQEDEEIVEDEEEIEEVEEERGGWSLKGVLNTLLVFVLLVLSTSYISSMNSPTPSPAVEAIEGLKDGYLKIQSHIFGAASVKGLEDGLAQAIEGVQTGYLKIQSLIFGGTSMKISERGREFMEQLQDRKMGLMEANQGAVDREVVGDENGGVAEETDELGEVVELQQGEENADLCGQEMEKTLEVSDQMAENLEIQEKTVEKFEAFQDDLIQTPEPVVPGISGKDVMNTNSISKEEQVEDASGKGGAGNEEMIADEIEGVEGITNQENTNSGVANLEPEVNLKEEEVTEPMGTESIPKVVIWASVFAIIVAPLVLGFHLKRKKSPKKDSPMTVNQSSESLVAEKSSIVVPPNESEDHIEKVESYANLSVEEASQELFSQSQAPTVELLGEYVVGEVSSTPKIYGMKIRMMMEGEESNHYSVSQEKGGNHLVPIHTQATLSALSTMDSPSYGSFTAEKSIRKKEEGRDGEVRKVVTTPVRRSSRIRCRAIMSP